MPPPPEHSEPDAELTEPSRPGSSQPQSAALVEGERLGRYLIVRRLGAGGMGIVYAAYDPQLDRKVALKLLHADDGRSRDHTKLLREAQALARLAHPNVVGVHDVGVHGERVWIAMELVAGKTLSWWTRARKPGWRDVADVILQAARGLAAAHRAGLVHRDVKPDNLMVDGDGRVRVMDFGLARASGQVALAFTGRAPVHDALSSPVTVAGSLVGTPAYMAPEQLAGLPADAMSDQFSLCVTAWEAVFGERPFAGDSFAPYSANVLAGSIQTPRRARVAPRWLRRVLQRGLCVDPTARWPSIDAFAEAIERGRSRVRARWWAGAALVGVVGVGALLVGQRIDRRARVAACEREGAVIREVWNADVGARVREALRATGASDADATDERIVPRLDRYADEWAALRTSVCMGAQVEGTVTPEVHALAGECLEDQRLALATRIELLEQADRDMVTNAVTSVAMLEQLAPCVDEAGLRRRPRLPSDPAARERVATLRAGLIRVRALDIAGREPAALELAASLVAAHEGADSSAQIADLKNQVAQLEGDDGHFDRAEAIGLEAFFIAVAAGADEIAVDAANELAFTIGHHLARPTEGLVWARLALTLLERVGESESMRMSGTLDALAMIEADLGDFTSAQAHLEQVIAMRERIFSADHPFVAFALVRLAGTFETQGDYVQAEPLAARALEIEERVLGPTHPYLATTLEQLAISRWNLGDPEGAEALLLRAVDIVERARGPDHFDIAQPLNSLGSLYDDMKKHDRAVAAFRRALPIIVSATGLESIHAVTLRTNLGDSLFNVGEYAEAKLLLEQALAQREKSGADSPRIADVLLALSQIASHEHATADAVRFAERAVAIRRRTGASAKGIEAAERVLAAARAGEQFAAPPESPRP